MDWRALEAMTDRIVLDVNLEDVRHFPKTAQGTADASRPIQNLKAVLYAPDPDEIVSLGQGFVSSFVSNQWALAVNRVDYPDLLFAKRDSFRALDRPGQPWFDFVRATVHSSSIIIVHLAPG